MVQEPAYNLQPQDMPRSPCLQQQWKHSCKSHGASSVSTDHQKLPRAKHSRRLSFSQQVCNRCPLTRHASRQILTLSHQWRNSGPRKLRRLVTAIAHQEESVIDFLLDNSPDIAHLGGTTPLEVSSLHLTYRNRPLHLLALTGLTLWDVQQ